MGKELEKATLAGGCFWGVQEILRQVDGILDTVVGYTGGDSKDPTYESICSGQTNHAEALQISFDPRVISFEEVLGYFWRLHDPTQVNRQGVDVGTHYRSVIFYHDDAQRSLAEKSKAEFEASKVFDRPVATEISPLDVFYRAEEEHQYFYKKNGGYVCHVLRDK